MFREWGKANETSATPRLLVQKLDRYGYKEAASMYEYYIFGTWRLFLVY